MRYILVILAAALVLSASRVIAEDLFLARVLAVDGKAGSLVVELMGNGGGEKTGELVIRDQAMAGELKPGDVVRIWGIINIKTAELTVTRGMSSVESSTKTDRSGVRMRLLKSMRHGGSGKGMGHGKP